MMKKPLVLFLLQGFILSGFRSLSAGAFQVINTGAAGIGGNRLYMPTQQRTLQQQQEAISFDRRIPYSSLSSSRPSTALLAGKQKKPSNVKVEPPKVDGLRMFLAYATPWRNPNSIFVYMLLILFLLGKYSEAKSASGGAL